MRGVPKLFPGKVRELRNLIEAKADPQSSPLAFRTIQAGPQTVANFLGNTARKSLSPNDFAAFAPSTKPVREAIHLRWAAHTTPPKPTASPAVRSGGCSAPRLSGKGLAELARQRASAMIAAVAIERSSPCAERLSNWHSQERFWRAASGSERHPEPLRPSSVVSPSAVTRVARASASAPGTPGIASARPTASPNRLRGRLLSARDLNPGRKPPAASAG
jgi:hypothetical protein